ncbi:MAG: S-layer family protein [Stigonema ocellatum SAG 48.90 = DSM 106950]|nr:S-layer family protein [Stigonema ocellatum SAG 48.90 = DSM 106950]
MAKFSADTKGGEGNIQLTTPALILRRGSSITTNANGSQITGGNIIIDSQNGFIVAVPGENSDITTNSPLGRGGNITIKNSAGIFGIEATTTPSDTTNDITATGATPDLSGNILFNRANVNQPLGLAKLPTVVALTPTIKNASCEALAEGKDSSFTITGRGGLPPNPYDPLSSEAVWSDNRVPNIISQHPHQEKPIAKPSSKATVVEINPATGWVFHGNGEVTLISQKESGNGLQSTPTTCQTVSKHMR